MAKEEPCDIVHGQFATMREALEFYADEDNWEEWQGGPRRIGGSLYRYEWTGSWDEAPRSMNPSSGKTRAKAALVNDAGKPEADVIAAARYATEVFRTAKDTTIGSRIDACHYALRKLAEVVERLGGTEKAEVAGDAKTQNTPEEEKEWVCASGHKHKGPGACLIGIE